MHDVDLERRRRFEGLLESYGADVVSYCRWRAETPNDAEDALADVFLVVWRRLDTVPDGDAARVWLYAAARRVIANQRRSSRRRAALRDRLMSTATDRGAPTFVERDGVNERVHAALSRLSDCDREVLLLSEWEGLSSSEIASVLRCRHVTARGRLHRARRRFREAFERSLPARVARTAEANAITNDLPKECNENV